MASELRDHLPHARRNVRLDTLVRLRWLVVVGQTLTLLIVHYVLDFTLPLAACLGIVALSAGLNVALRLRFHRSQRLEPDRAAWMFAFDIAQLAVVLYLTGGLQNPFSFLFLGPVLIAAAALPPTLTLPPIYMLGIWLSLLLALGVISAYAWQVAEEARLLADALAATELVLAREQHLSQLDGLAAAAAHELGTPLSTIALVVRELQNALEPGSPHSEDIQLL